MFEHGEVVGCVPCASAHLVVVEADVHGPMQPVFNAPMRTDRVAEASGIGFQTADIETLLEGRFSLENALALKHCKRLQFWPLFWSVQASDLIKNIATARFQPSMIFFHRLSETMRSMLERVASEGRYQVQGRSVRSS